jgi:hypothetical protein
MAWHHLQYVLGLKKLGHDVLFIEDSDDYPSCYDPTTHAVSTNARYGLRFAQLAFAKLGLADDWTYYDANQDAWFGPACRTAIDFCQGADVFLNVSGVNPVRAWLDRVPVRVFIDTDPAFTQIRHLTDEDARLRALQHNAFFTFGELIETPHSGIPDDGLSWQATRQPVVLDAWPPDVGPASGAFTTVMQWDSYRPIQFGDQHYGMKSESFDLVRDLPSRIALPLEIAMGGTSAPRAELEALGWRIVDPLTIARDPWKYQEYITKSRGEFSVAKHGYVVSRSGWFSERTACYLAMGRPAIVQETGFSKYLPCGSGLWAYDDKISAIEAIENVAANYQAECRAARELAMEFFDSRKVLGSLLERACSYHAADTV